MKRLGGCRAGLAVLSIGMLTGCGTVTPDIQEFWGTPDDAADRVNEIVAQVRCELRAAVRFVIKADKEAAAGSAQGRQLVWLENWLAQVTLTLEIQEKSNISPSLSFTDYLNRKETKTFTAALGGTFNNGATRTDTLQQLYEVRELLQYVPSSKETCIEDKPAPANLFVQSDLKIKDWLYTAAFAAAVGTAKFSAVGDNQNVLSHKVEFQIVTAGSFNPGWSLVTVTGNGGSVPFLGASRDRKQTLLITLGPPAPGKGPVLSEAAQNLDLAAQIRSAVAAGLAERRF